MMFNQRRDGVAEDSQTPRADARPAQTAGIDPPVYRPPTDVKNAGGFFDAKQLFLL
jgi:hypothetical protein